MLGLCERICVDDSLQIIIADDEGARILTRPCRFYSCQKKNQDYANILLVMHLLGQTLTS